MKPGLERITGLLELLADPHRIAPMVHVAGTNGKTSTARMTAAILTAHGLEAGLFTSPHLERIEERFEVGGIVMTPDELAAVVTELAPIVDLHEERTGDLVTYFELTTAMAFAWFAERAVAATVVETGLGGRLDSTNAADGAVAVVTGIGMEHTSFLGDTIEAIAGEKLAILDEGAVLVTGELPEEAVRVAERAASAAGGPWLRWGVDFRVADTERSIGGWIVDIDGAYASYEEVPLGVHGRHQTHNLAVAAAAVEGLLGRALDAEALRAAALSVTLPGRMEVVRRQPVVMLDGAHNPQGADTLGAALREEFPTTRWHLVVGSMADKDVPGILAPLEGLVTEVSATAAGSSRALPAAEMATAAAALGRPVTVHATVVEALDAALVSGDPVLITGSLYLVGEARTALGIL